MKNKIINYFLVFLLLILSGYLISLDNPVNKIKSGDYILECYFKDGWRVVGKDKILDFDEKSGTFIFTNGYAKNCIVYKNN